MMMLERYPRNLVLLIEEPTQVRAGSGVDVTLPALLPTWDPLSWKQEIAALLPFPILPYEVVELEAIINHHAPHWFTEHGRGCVRWEIQPNRLTYVLLEAITFQPLCGLVRSYDPKLTSLLHVVDPTGTDLVCLLDRRIVRDRESGERVFLVPVQRHAAAQYQREFSLQIG